MNLDLKKAVEHHLEEIRLQIVILNEVFKLVGEPAEGQKCDAIEGPIKETDGIIAQASGVAFDACLIAAAQAVENYEIARYGTLREWAKVLGHTAVNDKSSQILGMEKAANAKLTGLAIETVNVEARTIHRSKERHPNGRLSCPSSQPSQTIQTWPRLPRIGQTMEQESSPIAESPCVPKEQLWPTERYSRSMARSA